jgi:hypothetical protein
MKIVVFDLDETLGYFVEFGIFWDSLSLYLKKDLTQYNFNTLMDLYPEFLRPNIIYILNYLKEKKISNICQKIMIYTNNQGSRKWVNHLVSYFESKLDGYKLFDQIIAAFKINGKQIEVCRTTNNKTYKDFIRCTKLPVNAEICYLDDAFYPEMVSDNIYYINIKPYIHCLPFEVLFERFFKNEMGERFIISLNKKTEFIDFMNKEILMFHYKILQKTKEDYEIDKILSKKIMVHLEIFFQKHDKNKKTQRNLK